MRPYFHTAIFQRPVTGNLAMPVELDFSAVTEIDIDLDAELSDVGGIDFVQGVHVDNGALGDPLTLRFFTPANQGFTLRIPGKCEMWMPLLIPAGAVRFKATSQSRPGHIVQIELVNFPVQPILWNVP